MRVFDVLSANLLAPIPLAFALGVIAKLLKSEFSLPKDLYASLSIFLLWSLGLQGGVELHHADLRAIALPVAATLLLGCFTPVSTYFVLRTFGRFSVSDSAGLAAHYGSVSAVTFIAASTFVKGQGSEAEGFLPTLLTLMESPGIHLALAIGALKIGAKARPTREVLHEVLTGRTMILLVGGLLVGVLIGDTNWKAIEPFYATKGAVFRGALCLFMLGFTRGRPAQGRALLARLRRGDAGAARRLGRVVGRARWALGRWRHRARGHGGERFVHRGASGGAHHLA
jgi:uncharacterized protein